MRCETSFFSLTLYKKHLKRNWPMWAAWLGLWLLAMPVQLWNTAGRHRGENSGALREYAASMPLDSITILVPALAFLAALVAVVVFFHLFKGPAANFVGALPLRREGVFFTAFAAGYTMLVAPLVVVALVMALVEAVQGCLAPEILMFLGVAALNSFFWLSFAVLCCVISGHAVAAVAFYFIFNWIVPVMLELVQGLLGGFLYGFVGFGDGVYEVCNWLCPVLQLTRHQWRWDLDWNMVAIYAAVGFLMCLAALGLNHIRKAERSGDLIAFDPIKWLFKICVTFCGGMGFGTFFTIVIFNNVDLSNTNGWKFGVCCAVAAFLCYMVSEMLLAKSFKVWKHWKGAAVSAVAFILVVAAVDMDWIGFTTRVPDPASVKTVTATFGGTGLSSAAGSGLKFTGEDVKAITDLHQYLVDHRDEDDYKDKDNYLTVRLDYKVGWTSLQRRYTTWYGDGDELNQLLDTALGQGDISFPYDRGTPNYLSAELCLPTGNGDDAEYNGWEISTEDIKPVWDAVTADVKAGRYVLKSGSGENDVNTGTLYAEWWYQEVYGESTRSCYELRLSPEMTETWQTLKKLGYLDEERVSYSGATVVVD